MITLESVESGTEGLEIVLPETGAVAGQVLGVDNAPVREFEIRCVDERNRYKVESNRNFIQQQSEDGSFFLEGVEPGPCVVAVKVPGSSPTSVEIPMVKSGETIKGIVVRLQKETVVTGIVMDRKGQLLPNVGVFPGEAPGSEMPESVIATHTDSNGAFRLTGLAQETTVITAYHSDYALVSVPVKLTAGGSVPLRLLWPKGGLSRVRSIMTTSRGRGVVFAFKQVVPMTDMVSAPYRLKPEPFDSIKFLLDRQAWCFCADQPRRRGSS